MPVYLPSAMVAALIAVLASTQSIASEVKTWTHTSVEDFRKGMLHDVVIANTFGGELGLPHPMKKVVSDYQDNTVPRFVSRDSEGRYVHAWKEADGVYAQLHDAGGEPLGERFLASNITLDDPDVKINFSSPSDEVCTTLNPDGVFLIVWDCEAYKPRQGVPHSYRIYGQFCDGYGKPIGETLRIDEGIGSDSYYPTAFVDKKGIFWVVWSEQFIASTPQKEIRLYAQRYTRDGQRAGGNFRLIEEEVSNSQLFAAAAMAPNGDLAVAWKGDGRNLLIQWFDSDVKISGHAIEVDAFDQAIPFLQGLWRLDPCFDAQGDLLVVWELGVYSPTPTNGYGSIYGQFLRGRMPYREPFVIKERTSRSSRPDVFLGKGGVFQVSWMDDEIGSACINGWQWSPVDSGTFISEVFDTGPAGADFERISWNVQAIPETTVVTFRIRTGSDRESLSRSDWYGPDDQLGYYVSSGQRINPRHKGDRFLQYQAVFSTLDERKTPLLYDIAITYTSRDTVAPAPPKHLTATPGNSLATLSWRPNAEGDLSEYRLYRRTEGGAYDSTWSGHLPPSQTTHVDSSAETGTTYFYAVSAVDSNLNESRLSEEASATPFGKNWHVDGSASGEGDGSVFAPFLHIRDALGLAVYGDTVHVGPGSYAESITVGRGIVLLGGGYEDCKILNPDDQNHWWPPVVVPSDKSIVRGFSIHQRFGRGANAIYCNDGTALISENKIIANWAADAVFCNGASPIIADNIITVAETGVSSQGGSPLILRNVISNVGLGIHIDRRSGEDPLIVSRIQNNIIHHVNQGIFALRETEVEIVNNTIYLGQGTDLSAIVKVGRRVTITSNIIVHRGRARPIVIDYQSFCELSYDDIWGIMEDYAECEVNRGNIALDPLFVNVDKGDFRLRPNSPCRDAGSPEPAWNDLDGTRNDMGAYGGPDPIHIGVYHPKVAVAVPPVSGAAGDTLITLIELDNAAGLAGAVIALSYDPALLVPLRAETTEVTSGFSLTYLADVGGMVRIVLSRETELEGGEGSIAKIAFAVSSIVSKDAACPLEVRQIELRDGAGALIEIGSLTDGAFVVVERGLSEELIYVDQRYAGEEKGSWSRPFNSVGEAMAAASAGDTIQVAGGIYREHIMMREGVFLRGSGPLASKIWVENDTPNMAAVTFQSVSRGGIKGFDIRRSGRFGGPTVECRASSPLIARNRIISGEGLMGSAISCQGTTASQPQIEDNLIEVGRQGTGIWCNTSNPIISGNRLLVATGDFGGVDATAVSCETSDPLILNNEIRLGEGAIGIQCLNSSHVTIAGNYLGGNARSQWAIRGSASSLRVTNNLLRGFETAVLSNPWGSPSSALVENNVFWENGTVVTCDEGSSVRLSYNMLWNNALDYDGCPSNERDTNADPLFVDPEGGDFHLQEGSSGIDGGDPDPQYNDPDGSRNDVGIYGGPYAASGKGVVPAVKSSLPDLVGAPGDTLSLPVEVTNASGVAEAQMVVAYPSESISVLDVRTTESSRAFALTTERVAEGEVRIAMSYPTGLTEGTGSLVDLTLVVNANAAVGSESKITIKEMALRDELAGVVLASARKAGTIRIAPPTAVESGEGTVVPFDFALFQNHPNPFNLSTVISFTLPERPVTGDRPGEAARLVIYNSLGQEVRTLVKKTLGGGQYRVVWDGRDNLGQETSSGVYVYQLTGGRRVGTRKMVLLR